MRVTTLPLAVTAYTATSAVGAGLDAHLRALRVQRSGLRANDFSATALPCWIGRVADLEQVALPDKHAGADCRNNRLAWLGLNQDEFLSSVAAARRRYGALRVALLLGTSTASIGATEDGYRRLEANGSRLPADLRRAQIHTPHSLTAFVAAVLDIAGPCLTISTACSSSAKVFASAERLIRLGIVDAAVVGGVDSLCDSVLFGFNALELVSPEPCRPFDAKRRGISIGEAAGFALLERLDHASAPLRWLGCGESSDAYHMSAPDPHGAGAELALRDLFERTGLTASDVDYINLHGTASQKNDAVEAALVARLFPASTRVSSTKRLTGHTLGAAGILEAVITLLALREGFVPGNSGTIVPDPACTSHFAWQNEVRPVRIALSHSFGFGGSNACLAFAHESHA